MKINIVNILSAVVLCWGGGRCIWHKFVLQLSMHYSYAQCFSSPRLLWRLILTSPIIITVEGCPILIQAPKMELQYNTLWLLLLHSHAINSKFEIIKCSLFSSAAFSHEVFLAVPEVQRCMPGTTPANTGVTAGPKDEERTIKCHFCFQS